MDADAEGPPPGFGARAFSVAVDPAAVSVPGAPRARAFAAADAAAAARDERAAVGSAAERARACPLRRTEAFFSAENADDKNDKNESAVGDFQNEPLRDARAEVPRFPGAGSTFRARSASAASLVSSVGSVGSVASEDTYFEVGTLGLGSRRRWGERKGETTTTPGVSLPRRRLTRARAATRHRGLRGPRKTLFTGPPRELPTHAFAFFTEIFKLRGTILLKIVPQIVLAAIAGLCANVAKIVYCGEGVTSNEECDVTFNLDGHLGVSVVLSFLLVFRADLAWKRYEQGKAALGAVHGGIRNLNVAAAVFLRRRARDETKTKTKTKTNGDDDDDDDYDDDDALASDRAEIFRLTNLLYAFVRHAARGQRHGYSDVGPVTDDELLTRDRGGKPRVPDLFLNAEEAREFKTLDAWNRPNVCASLISDIVEHRRRVGSLGERAAMDAFRDLRVVLDALKSMERIVTTPIPYQYLHMLNVLLFFFVYSVPFVFTANFKWVTPFPSAVVALAFYGVNEIGRCMEDPFSWEEPCHDLSAVGWRSYRENAQIHADADDAAAKEAKRVLDAYHGNGRARAESGHSVVSGLADNSRDAAARYFTSDDDARSTTASEGERDTRKRRDTLRFFGDVSGTDVDDGDDDDSAATVDPGMLPKELSTHWTGFIAEIFVFRDTVMPTLLPQIVVAFALGLAAQIVKMRACGADVVAAAECQTTFDITGHQVVSVSLGFLLVFRTDWAYDRYYEGKASLGQLYGGMRNLNVLFVNFLRENRPGECAAFARAARTSNVDGRLDPGANERNLNAGKVTARTSHGSAAGTYDERDAERTPAERVEIARRVRRDRAELLRLTNVMYAVMRHALRELRVGRAERGPSSDEECVLEDHSGAPRLPTYLRPGESAKLLSLSPSNRHNWIAMRVQNIVETNRRLGFIGERAAFEIYQELESCLAAYKTMERIVSTPIPHTYTHMLQLILFFFVFSAPFVFTTTFHWIGFVPSVIVAVGFYGVNEMGKLIQDPFDWRQPCHDLSGTGRRAFEENLRLHECAEERERRAREKTHGRRRRGKEKKRRTRRERKNARSVASDEHSHSGSGSDDDEFFRDPSEVSLSTLREALEGSDVKDGNHGSDGTPKKSSTTTKEKDAEHKTSASKRRERGGDSAIRGGDEAKTASPLEEKASRRVLARLAPIPALEYAGGPWAFITTLFRVRGTVLPRVFPQVLFAVVSSLCAQTLKIYWCGADIVSHAQCSLAFSETAHAVAGGVIGFMLVFRTSISYYRFYEGKKYLGHLHDALRNANVGFCAFLRTNRERDERKPDDGSGDTYDAALNADRVELRRLSNVLFAFVRQSVRERRHGYKEGCLVTATDTSLLRDDIYGAPSLSTLLDEGEADAFIQVDPENRANVVVWRMQSIVERHRRLGNVCERGAFDIYHDLEACLEAHKHMERVVSTKMPFQYLHAVNFLLFVFVFSAPFVFTTGFKWLSPVPSCIVAVAFYGVAEVARSIEDPYSWEQPCHDLSGVGWRLYVESLELHEASVENEDKRAEHDSDKGAEPLVKDSPRGETNVSVVEVSMGKKSKTNVSSSSHAETPPKDSSANATSQGRRRVSVAHGFADRALVVSGRPDPRVATEAAKRRVEGEMKSREKNEKEKRLFPDGEPSSADASSAPAPAAAPASPELSNSRFGFFFDVFRVRGTVHGEVFPQVTLAFAVGWAAQLAKLWRCGGMVQEAYECAVTFEPHAHAVVGSVLAFMIVYRFKFAYDRYYEAKTAISELHCGLRNFSIGACAFLRLDEAPAADAKSKSFPDANRQGSRGGMFFWKKKESSSSESSASASGGGGVDDDARVARRASGTEEHETAALPSTPASALLRERTELLRLSGCLFGFLRHRLREHRLGYPWDAKPRGPGGSDGRRAWLAQARLVAARHRRASRVQFGSVSEPAERRGDQDASRRREATPPRRDVRTRRVRSLPRVRTRARRAHFVRTHRGDTRAVPVRADVALRDVLLRVQRAVHLHDVLPIHLVLPVVPAGDGVLRHQLHRRGDRAPLRLARAQPRPRRDR
jgi:predicted membrane chloride channel (bestrophin family)